ncbi:MAG: tetratricopeptide repeat protein [Planctomycetota bacterium]|nr:tetratricopeptide repeat protein [Planctomycetota bacterium]
MDSNSVPTSFLSHLISPRHVVLVLGMLFLVPVVPTVGGPVDSTTVMQPGDLDLPGQAPGIIAAIGQFRRGDRESALKSLEAAAKSDPELPPPKIMLARMHLFNREIDANGRQTQLLAAIVCRQLADYATAEKHLQRLFDDNPTDFQVVNLLALVLIEQPREADQRRALQLAQLNLQRYPQSNEARATLGWIQLRQGKLDEASEALQGAVAQGAVSPDTAYYIARRHAKLEDRRDERVKPVAQIAVQATEVTSDSPPRKLALRLVLQ